MQRNSRNMAPTSLLSRRISQTRASKPQMNLFHIRTGTFQRAVSAVGPEVSEKGGPPALYELVLNLPQPCGSRGAALLSDGL